MTHVSLKIFHEPTKIDQLGRHDRCKNHRVLVMMILEAGE
jgi:hypothetical protein